MGPFLGLDCDSLFEKKTRIRKAAVLVFRVKERKLHRKNGFTPAHGKPTISLHDLHEIGKIIFNEALLSYMRHIYALTAPKTVSRVGLLGSRRG